MWQVVFFIGREKRTQQGFKSKTAADLYLMSICFTGYVEIEG